MRKFGKRIIVTFMLLALCAADASHATNISDLKDDRDDAQQKLDDAEETINDLKNSQDDIMQKIEELDNKINDYNQRIEELTEQKQTLVDEIATTRISLETAKELEQEQYEAMKKRIQYSYESNNINYLDAVFSAADVGDVIDRAEYAEQIYNYDERLLNELVDVRKDIADKELKLETDLAAVEEITEAVEEELEVVNTLLAGKEEQLQSFTSAIEEYQAQADKYRADVEATNAAIAKAEEEARKAALLAQQQQQNNQSGSNQTFTNEGYGLSWPVAGGANVITSVFGPRWGTNHNGLDMGVPVGTPIMACASGTVILSRYSASAGNYIIIDHGNGMTTVYMHNSSLLVSVGQVVQRGETIALSGNTGWSTGPHCHLGVRVNGAYVDPQLYLQ